MGGVLMEYRETFRMHPIYKEFNERTKREESSSKKSEEQDNEFDKLFREILK